MAGERLRALLMRLVYPHKCFLCGAVLADAGWVCDCCELSRVDLAEVCARCSKPHAQCVCDALQPAFAAACAPLYYERGVCHGIHRYKYDGRYYYAPFLAGLIVRSLLDAGAPRFSAVTFVPMTRRKRKARGFCPSEMLAREIAKRLGCPVWDDLLRHTAVRKAQAGLHAFADRLENAARSFEATDRIVEAGATVLLVDDVFTTGATADRCAGLLRGQGASSVWVAAAATTRPRKKRS